MLIGLRACLTLNGHQQNAPLMYGEVTPKGHGTGGQVGVWWEGCRLSFYEPVPPNQNVIVLRERVLRRFKT